MVTTYPTTGLPKLWLEDKYADVRAFRSDNDFCFAWQIPNTKQLVVAEWIPENYPPFTLYTSEKTVKAFKKLLKEIGYEFKR